MKKNYRTATRMVQMVILVINQMLLLAHKNQ